jgi:transposase-like protein|tara:strand:+ start:1010 stop:1513 length:504 start_codon:yes stop_codon:yes gene_type:complete
MPKKFPRAVKERAFKLYLADDYSAREIAQQISAEHKTVVNEQTIYAWIKQDDWKLKRAETKVRAVEKVQENESTKLAKMQDEHQELYKSIRDKAGSELQLLNFERAFDAVKALDVGIQGERQVAEGLINIQFVQDVVNILVDEIEDPELIKKIAAKLKVLMASKDNE